MMIVEGLMVIPTISHHASCHDQGDQVRDNEMMIILAELNSMAIRAEIRIMARIRLSTSVSSGIWILPGKRCLSR